MKPQTLEDTVQVQFKGLHLAVSLIMQVQIDDNYGATIDGVGGMRRAEYELLASYIDNPPQSFTVDEMEAIVNIAQTQFIRRQRGAA